MIVSLTSHTDHIITFISSETESVWLSQKFPNFKTENVDGNGNDDNGNGNSIGDDEHSNGDGNKTDKGGNKGDERKDYGADRKDGSWTFPYYSCNHQAWLASLVIPIRADNR